MEYDIAVIPGDGIGPEVTGQALKVMEAAGRRFGFGLRCNVLPYGASHYLATGEILPASALAEIGSAKALLLGAVGDPRVPMGPLEQELLLAVRFHFDLYLNLRPARSLPRVRIPLRSLEQGQKIDLLVVRENTEDFYMGLGGRGMGDLRLPVKCRRGNYDLAGDINVKLTPETEAAVALGVMTAPGVARITKKAFELAAKRGEKNIHVAGKANAVPSLYGFWDEKVALEAKKHRGMTFTRMNIDNLCYQLPRAPLDFGVILCPNLFGDIVSDLASALIGGLGLSPSANIGDGLCMFEPVHGSAPTIAGTGRANPLAAILSGALLLENLGETEAAQAVDAAVTGYLTHSPSLPYEIGGSSPTGQVGQTITGMVEAGE
ncbi:MAG: isocitrate/isopropylmalate dehydrogenase family protein [Deltaproteobacteria bacterium]|jgi:3-isopropylmalate dehydrogenase|nr:isocitrate/isopropylmalate dehydrogenase family protein [Deltaproteobacteria bacterium]